MARKCSKMLFVSLITVLSMALIQSKPLSISSNSSQDDVGNYQFKYENTKEFVNRTETGRIVKSEGNDKTLNVTGSYSNGFNKGNCQTITVNYVADKNGFRVNFSYREVSRYPKEGENIMIISHCRSKTKSAGVGSQNISTAAIRTLGGGGFG